MSEANENPTPDSPSIAKVFDIRSAGRSSVEPSTAEIRTAGSVLLDRMQFMRQAGLTFKGLRDLYEILGYARVIMPRDYRERYARGGIAARVVDAFPKATWRGGGELVEDEDPKVSTDLEKAWVSLNKRLKIWSTFGKLDILTGQGRYAVLLIGDGENLSSELKKYRTPNPKKLLYLTPFSEEDALIQEWDQEITSPRFGMPTKYMLRRNLNNTANWPSWGMPPFASAAFNMPVHWSRIIHVAENCLDNEVFGQPRLERVWNLLDDLDKVTGGGAEAFWLRANQGIQLDVDKDMTLSQPEKDALKTQADEYQHQIRRMLRTRGVKIETLGSDVANFSNPADAILTQIAGSLAIPKRILTGSEMGELASSQDRDNWKDQVNGRQTEYAGPYIVRPFVDRLIEYGYLPTPKDEEKGYEVKWPHIQVLTEQEKAEGAGKWATAATAEGPVFTRDEIRDKWYSMEPLPKPDLNKETGVHTAPGSGLEVDVAVDPETGLPLKKPEPPTIAVDPETGLPVEVDTKLGLPAHTVQAGKPRPGVVDGDPTGLPTRLPGRIKAAGARGSNQFADKPGGKEEDVPKTREQMAQESVGQNGGDGVEWQQPLDKNGRPVPIKAKSVEEAAQLVYEGKVVEVEDARTAFTLINKLGAQAQEAKAAGLEAKNFDMCQISIPGGNLFCASSLRSKEYPNGVPRVKMPQMGGEPLGGSDADKLPRSKNSPNEVNGSAAFVKHMESLGIKTATEKVSAASLRASQAELIGPKIAEMMNAKDFDPGKEPIFVSRDDYVVDGHHRWATAVGRDAEDNKLGDSKMNVIRIDAPISEVLHLANVWSAKFGIKQKVANTKPRGQAKEPRTAEELIDEVLVQRLTTALEHNDTDALDQILGITRPTILEAEEAPSVVVNMPPRRVKKTFTYGEVDGQMRPTGVLEEEL